MKQRLCSIFFAALGFLVIAAPSPAAANLVLDQVIVDIEADQIPRGDIEMSNEGTERLYILIEPSEILDPGLETQRRVPLERPSISGVLVTPNRVILEPGEKRTVRIAAIGDRPAKDRIFRVMIRPVVGELEADNDGLKVMVGYDALVLLRSTNVLGKITGERTTNSLILRNQSNAAQELFEGEQCDDSGENCVQLPSKRLYPEQEFRVDLPYTTEVSYRAVVGKEQTSLTF